MEDPNFEVKLNKWYQGMKADGPNGLLRANAMLNTAFDGNVTPGLLNMVNMRPETMQKEMSYNSDLQSKMGLSPEIIRRASEDFPLLVNRIYMFIDAVKMRFAGELLPTLEWVFDFISKAMMKSADSISGGIRQFAQWAFTEMPYMAINGLRMMIGVGHVISETFFGIAEAAIGMLRGMGGKKGALYSVLSIGASFLDDINNIGANFMAGLTYFILELSNMMAKIPGVKQLVKYETGADLQEYDSMKLSEAVWKSYNPSSYLKTLNDSAEAGNFGTMADSLEKNVGAGRAFVNNNEKMATDFLDNSERALGPQSQRQQDFAGFAKEIVQATKEGSQNVVSAINKTGGGGSDSYAPALGHIMASYALRARRRS